MKRVFINALTFLICLLVLCSCTDYISKEGLEHFRKSQYADSEFDIAGQLFLSVDFLDKYPYLQGDYNYDYVGDLFFANTTDRAFAWLTYEEEIYEQAKQECVASRETNDVELDEIEAFGFIFYTKHEFGSYETGKFPYYFTAFGFNDQTDTLVFIGFYCNKQSDEEKLQSAKTDLEGFIQNYFGEWYNWEK